MKPNYSLVHLTVAACPPPDMIYAAARAGFDCVSFRGIPTHLEQASAASGQSVSEAVTGRMPFDFANNPPLLRSTVAAAAETGVVMHDIENARIYDGVVVRRYEPDLAAAAELGIRHVLTNIWTDDKSFSLECFCELCELAAPYGITINLEFVTWSAVKDLRAAGAVLTASGCKNVGIVVDTLHYHRSRVTLDDFDGMPAEWFHYLHLCDCGREIPTATEDLIHTGLQGRLLPGEGAADIAGVVAKIPHAVRGIEVPNPTRMQVEGLDRYLAHALQATKQYLHPEH